MVYRRSTTLISAAISLILILGSAPIAYAGNPSASASGNGEHAPALKRVDSSYVCMVNNRLYDKEQIPVKVGERTYYGCCEGCKTALRDRPALRQAIDPTTGTVVDKATAVVGALPDGSVYYFENMENLKKIHTDHTHGEGH